MSDVFLTNTLSGAKEKFVSLVPNKVKLYSCGPTVYNFAHIGNFRSFLTSDLLSRVLNYAGYDVKKVMNITDVGHLTGDDTTDAGGEDKISRAAREQQIDPFQIARKFEEAFLEDEAILRILPAWKYPRATDYIKEQITLADILIKRDYAYEVNGSVYFRTKKFEKYGELSGNKLEDLIAGARVEINSEKEDPMDFALWKKADENHLMQWESPWGSGFPGWHAECSAMSKKLLGFPFDIHTGGEDNVFPHHECEIAQNECSTNGKKSVNYWLHTKYLLVGGKKMSKSAGNFYTIRDLLAQGWKGNEIRLALFGAHYRATLDFSEDSLVQARESINRILEARQKAAEKIGYDDHEVDETYLVEEYLGFREALFDDLNAPLALSFIFEAIKTFNRDNDSGFMSSAQAATLITILDEFALIFDCFPAVDEAVQELFSVKIRPYLLERLEARRNKKWDESDRIRDLLLERFDVELKDEVSKGGELLVIRWKKRDGSSMGMTQLPKK